jgi:hypothetical protein
LCNEEERNYKVRDAADMQAPPQMPIEEYISDSSMGSDDDAPTTRRAPPMVATFAPWCMRQATGKILASWATTTIVTTQMAEAKKKKRKSVGPTVLVNTAMVISGVETIDVGDDEEDDAASPGATAAPSAGTPRRAAMTEELAMEMPRRTSTTEERPRSSADAVGNLGSHNRERKAPSKPCKPGLRSATE